MSYRKQGKSYRISKRKQPVLDFQVCGQTSMIQYVLFKKIRKAKFNKDSYTRVAEPSRTRSLLDNQWADLESELKVALENNVHLQKKIDFLECRCRYISYSYANHMIDQSQRLEHGNNRFASRKGCDARDY